VSVSSRRRAHVRIDRTGDRSQSWPFFSSGRDKECNLSKKLYVGNLPFTSTEEELKEVFGRHGTVDSVAVITDRETGRPRGFAFVEMSEESAASDAIRALDGSDLGGRNIKVNEAQDKQRGGGGGGRY
jgi:RNA recognition motif-containing protein